MAKVNVVGSALIVTSELKTSELELAAKYRPSALKLRDEDGNEIFGVQLGTPCHGSIGTFGVVFDTTSPEGKAQVTCAFAPKDTAEETKEAIADQIGKALINLAKFEEAFATVAGEITKERNGIMSNITVA